MKVLLSVTSLWPEYGGPAFSVSRLAAELAGAGIDVGLWAPDQSALSTPVLPAASTVKRFGGPLTQALDNFGRPDVIHDNGIWLAHNHQIAVLAAKRAIPRMVSTRGMVDQWSLSHKRWKKGIAWRLYQRRDLASAQCLHTTAESEAASVKSFQFGGKVCVIPNGIDVPDAENFDEAQVVEHTSGSRTALFLSRLHPKKGLLLLIEAWSRLRPAGWKLRIAGPDEGGHKKILERAVLDSKLSDVISFLGPLEGANKAAAFREANLFILPTLSENFGIVVAEALAHGLPVLTTTGAPWSLLPKRNCGWWVAPTVDGIAEGLSVATSQSPATLRAMGDKGRTLVLSEFSWNRIAKLMISEYSGIVR